MEAENPLVLLSHVAVRGKLLTDGQCLALEPEVGIPVSFPDLGSQKTGIPSAPEAARSLQVPQQEAAFPGGFPQ